MGYIDAIKGNKPIGKVAVVGAGGIGFDVKLITHEGTSSALDIDLFAWSGVSISRTIPAAVPAVSPCELGRSRSVADAAQRYAQVVV